MDFFENNHDGSSESIWFEEMSSELWECVADATYWGSKFGKTIDEGLRDYMNPFKSDPSSIEEDVLSSYEEYLDYFEDGDVMPNQDDYLDTGFEDEYMDDNQSIHSSDIESDCSDEWE